MRRVRILFRVAMFVMLEMELSVGLGMQKRRALRDKRTQVEKSLPENTHRKHSMSHIPVQEKALGKDTGIPMDDEKANDY